MVIASNMFSSFPFVLLAFGVFITSCAGSPKPSFALQGDELYSEAIFELSKVASNAYSQNRWTDAARHYERLTSKVPHDAYVWFRLANTYAQQGQYNQAIEAYEKSINWDAQQPKPWFNLSTTYLLNAKSAMLQSREYLRENDPARQIIKQRIQALDELMNISVGDGAE